jgi:hypothetical protein
MPTDEFEISLFRELKVCGNTIKRILKFLDMMERKHKKSTASFIDEYRSGTLNRESDFKEDYKAWESSYESLILWRDLDRRYQARSSSAL